jgi:hypothetical protein
MQEINQATSLCDLYIRLQSAPNIQGQNFSMLDGGCLPTSDVVQDRSEIDEQRGCRIRFLKIGGLSELGYQC